MTSAPLSTPAQARVDSWTWAVRIFKTRSAAAAACRAGHVKVNGVPVKPAHSLKPGDEIRTRVNGSERIVIVERLLTKRVGAAVVPQYMIDKSPPPPDPQLTALLPHRDRGAGRPTKRERRETDRLLGREGLPSHEA